MKNKNFFKINIIYLIAISLVAIIFAFGYLGLMQNEFIATFLIQIIVMFAIPMLLYTLFVSKSYNKTFSDTGLKKISFKIIIISFILGVALYIINTFVADLFQIIIQVFGYENISSSQTITLDYGTLLKEFVLSAILPAICEEFLHRGIMLMTSRKYHNPRIALITSSLIFGLIHLNINQFFYAGILGLMIGYVALISDSIIPCMIIHFMNNFLSTYFYYGHYMKFPLVQIVEAIESVFMSNIMLYILANTLILALAIWTYIYFTRKIIIERVKSKMFKTINSLKLENSTAEEAQSKLNEINYIISHSNSAKSVIINNGEKSNFVDKIPLILSIILGVLITISSFIWGII